MRAASDRRRQHLQVPAHNSYNMLYTSATSNPDTNPIEITRRIHITTYFPKSSFNSRIYLLCKGFFILPLQFFRTNFQWVLCNRTNLSITQLNDLICHILNRGIMCNHYDRISIFLVHHFNEF